jgi:hypothetical protein
MRGTASGYGVQLLLPLSVVLLHGRQCNTRPHMLRHSVALAAHVAAALHAPSAGAARDTLPQLLWTKPSKLQCIANLLL